MAHIMIPPGWQGKNREVTPEAVFQNRREFLRLMGFTGLGIASALVASPAYAQTGWLDLDQWFGSDKDLKIDFKKIPGLKRNPAFEADRPMTVEEVALKYNNFYEFTSVKEGVWKSIDKFQPKPWQVEIAGHVEHPAVYDVEDLISQMPLEERIYRHRCVETWAMIVPWNGFPMKALIKKVQPTDKAKFVRFTSFRDPKVAPGQAMPNLPWPYTEGLTLAEAMNDLAFVGTGIYGHVLPAQHGAPLRMVLPWKYGFKSIKSITKIEFVEQQPATFWNILVPQEYDFQANVNPDMPHPRWSQRREKMIGTGDIFATRKYNGYGDWVADLYA